MIDSELLFAFLLLGTNVSILILDSKINKLRRRMDKIDGGEDE